MKNRPWTLVILLYCALVGLVTVLAMTTGCSGIRTRITQLGDTKARIELFYDGKTAPNPDRPPICCAEVDALNPDVVESCPTAE